MNDVFGQIEVVHPGLRPAPLPSDCVSYLAKRGVSVDTSSRFSLCYSEATRRMLIPVFDEYDVLKYILGRSIYHNFNSPRYVCYGRRDRSVFFGLNMVQKKHPDAIVVEGPIDAMRLHDAGYHNVVAIVGSYLDIDPEWQAKADKLTIFSAVVLAFDGYPGGHPQQKKLADYLSSRSVAVKEIFLPAARDPADLDADELIYFFGSK